MSITKGRVGLQPRGESPTETASNHHHRSWIDDPKLPIAMIGSYVERIQAGEDIHRPVTQCSPDAIGVTDEYRALLPEQTRHAFDRQLAQRGGSGAIIDRTVTVGSGPPHPGQATAPAKDTKRP